jgi:predicted cytidylate kinase
MKTTSVAVSGQCSSGKSTLCILLAQKLGWRYVNVGNEFKRLATKYKLEIEDFGSIPENILRNIDTQIEKRIKQEHNVIWDSRLTCYLAREYSHIFKVYCEADLDIRAKRTSGRDEISFEKAIQIVRSRDKEEETVYKRLYRLHSPYDPSWIDLILDTSKNKPEELVDMVIKAFCKLKTAQV